MTELKLLAARIWKLPPVVFVFLTLLLLGWSHWKDVKNERTKHHWATRIEAIEANFENTQTQLNDHKAHEKRLKDQMFATKARGGATEAQIRAFGVEKARLERQLLLIDKQSKQTQIMIDKLEKDKDAGFFDKR